jgi:hypothetical protein
MLTRAASPHFTERTRQSWRILGYGGISVVFLSSFHVPATIVGLAAAAFVLPPIWNFVVSNRERNGDKLPAPASLPARPGERREFETLPFGLLFDIQKKELEFEALITEAAYCSNEYGRRLAVICLRIPGLSSVMRDSVAGLLRKNIRDNDELETASDEEFLICLHLLRDALDAEVVVRRLEAVLRNSPLSFALLEVQLGKAVYPMDGYTGADLISQARSKLRKIAIPW